MPPSAIASRLSIFSGSRRSKKAVVVADPDDNTLANAPSTPAIPPSAPDSSADPAVAAVEIIETAPGPEPPSIWLTDPTNAIITGKPLDVAVPTVPYNWPKVETDTNRASNAIGHLVSKFRRKVAQKPKPEKSSALSGSPPLNQSTTIADANTDDPPPWTPPSTGLLDPNNAATNVSTPSTVPRERQYRTLGQEFYSKLTRTASASLHGLRKKSRSSAGVREGAERNLDGIKISVTKETLAAEAVAREAADTPGRGQSQREDTGEGGAENEIREEDIDPPSIATNAALAAVAHRSILKTDDWVDPRAEKACEKKPSIRFVEPLPRRPDPLPEATRLRINQRRPRGKKPARPIVSAHGTSSWVAEAVLAQAKDLSKEQRWAEELHRSLMDEVELSAEEDGCVASETEEDHGNDLGAPGSGGDASGVEEPRSQHQAQVMSPPVPVPSSIGLTESTIRAEEMVDIGPRVQDPSLDHSGPPAAAAHPSNPSPEVINPSFISNNTRQQFLSPFKSTETPQGIDGIEEVPRTPAPSVRSSITRVGSGGEEVVMGVPVPDM